MLQNAYLLAKIGADTAENERNFAEILPKIGNYPTGPRPGPRMQALVALRRPPWPKMRRRLETVSCLTWKKNVNAKFAFWSATFFYNLQITHTL